MLKIFPKIASNNLGLKLMKFDPKKRNKLQKIFMVEQVNCRIEIKRAQEIDSETDPSTHPREAFTQKSNYENRVIFL